MLQAHEARQFTDTANFTLRCGICQLPVKGEKEAVEHAKATGHQRFGEY
jgi:ubiquitin thioesterase OTU1